MDRCNAKRLVSTSEVLNPVASSATFSVTSAVLLCKKPQHVGL